MRKLLTMPGNLARKIAAWGYHVLYNDWAGAYDAVAAAVSFGRWYDWVAVVLPWVRGSRVLEVGAGTGHLLAALAAAGNIKPIGVDASRNMLRLARDRTAGRVPLVRCVAQSLPVASLAFDSIVSTFPAEFIRDGRTIREFHRALRAGGRALIVPVAQLVERNGAEGIMAWALATLGEAPSNSRAAVESTLVPLLEQEGFRTELRELEPSGGRVFLIIATKAQAPS